MPSRDRSADVELIVTTRQSQYGNLNILLKATRNGQPAMLANRRGRSNNHMHNYRRRLDTFGPKLQQNPVGDKVLDGRKVENLTVEKDIFAADGQTRA
jgi:hypothetical protein